MFPGAATAPDGISIDLKLLNELRLSEDRETVFVGTGNRWTNVYGFLDPWNLTAVGGRAGFVGVGGFLLGGELIRDVCSFEVFAVVIAFGLRRWNFGDCCLSTDIEQADFHTSPENTDGEQITFEISRHVFRGLMHIISKLIVHQVVLANGSISQINYQSHPDLYWALRGGGSNFGIVTRFDLETHPQGLAWGDFNAMFASNISARLSSLGVSRRSTSMVDYLYFKVLAILTKIASPFGYCTDLDTYAEQLWRTLEGSKDDPYLQVYGYFSMGIFGDWAGFHMMDGKGREDVSAYHEVRSGKKVLSVPTLGGIVWHADHLSMRSENFGAR